MAASQVVRQLPNHLKELRIHLCQRSTSSQGVREWVEKYYVDLKKANPKFPFLIRECSGVSPVVFARYGENDKIRAQHLKLCSQQCLDASVKNMAKKTKHP